MTQEDKLLLFKDLCTRFPYEVNILVNIEYLDIKGIGKLNKMSTYNFLVDIENFEPFKENKGRLIDFGGKHPLTINEIKPYLRPMSNMTEKEKIEYNIIKCSICPDEADDYAGFVDWLNEHQLDYRGLIEKGLALEAPEGMYNTKIK